MDGVNDVVVIVVVTDESNDAVGVTIVEHDEDIDDGYLFNGRLSLLVNVVVGNGGRNLFVSSVSCVAKRDGFVLRKICDGDDGDDEEFDDDDADDERREGMGKHGVLLLRCKHGDEQ